jgi:hypothetical protein
MTMIRKQLYIDPTKTRPSNAKPKNPASLRTNWDVTPATPS